MAKEFISVFKLGKIQAEMRPLPSRIRIKGKNYEYKETVKNAKHYADILYRMRLTCELHNRDAEPDDLYEIQEERITPTEAPS